MRWHVKDTEGSGDGWNDENPQEESIRIQCESILEYLKSKWWQELYLSIIRATCCHSSLMTSLRSWSANRASLRSMCWYTLFSTRKNCLSKLSTDPILDVVLLISPELAPKLDPRKSKQAAATKTTTSLQFAINSFWISNNNNEDEESLSWNR